jgi:hypothetical protein
MLHIQEHKTPFWHLGASCFCGGGHFGFLIRIKKHKLSEGPSNEHSHQNFIQLAKRFWQRSK